jgi:hypothetical protein
VKKYLKKNTIIEGEAVTAKYVLYSKALVLDDLEFHVVRITYVTPDTCGITDKGLDQQFIEVQFGFL